MADTNHPILTCIAQDIMSPPLGPGILVCLQDPQHLLIVPNRHIPLVQVQCLHKICIPEDPLPHSKEIGLQLVTQ